MLGVLFLFGGNILHLGFCVSFVLLGLFWGRLYPTGRQVQRTHGLYGLGTRTFIYSTTRCSTRRNSVVTTLFGNGQVVLGTIRRTLRNNGLIMVNNGGHFYTRHFLFTRGFRGNSNGTRTVGNKNTPTSFVGGGRTILHNIFGGVKGLTRFGRGNKTTYYRVVHHTSSNGRDVRGTSVYQTHKRRKTSLHRSGCGHGLTRVN